VSIHGLFLNTAFKEIFIMADKNKLKLAVVGVGHLGQHHARLYSQLDELDLVCVVDIDEARAKSVARNCKTRYVTDYRQIESQLDAVSIAVPTRDHFEVAQSFLSQGISVLLEKPIASSLEQAEKLAELAEKQGTILQIGHVERFNPAVVALAKRVRSPKYIETHRLGPFVARGMDVDVILDLMIHDLDIVLSGVSSPLCQVQAVGMPIVSEHVDIANVRLEFEDGCVANMNTSRVSLTHLRKLRLFQQDTYFSLDAIKQDLTVVRLDKNSPSRLTGLPFKISREKVKLKKQEPLKAELESFVNCVRRKQPPLVSAREGIRALRVALDINSKIKQALQKSMLIAT
jgi:predicted dehydrogenase